MKTISLSQVKKEFEKFLNKNNKTASALFPLEGIELMKNFYTEQRVKNCVFENDGDQLLFQWGTGGLNREFFVYDITRQLIPDDEDGGVWQLSLAFNFKPTKELLNLKSGNKWCCSPDEINDFEKFILESPATELFKNIQPVSVEVNFGNEE